MSTKTTNQTVIAAAKDESKAGLKTAEVLRLRLSGTKDWKEKKTIYKSILQDVRDNENENDAKRINAVIRKAWQRLPNKPMMRSRNRGTTASKVTVTKAQGTTKAQLAKTARSPKALASTLKVLVANLQAAEKPQFKDTPRLIAALQAALALAV